MLSSLLLVGNLLLAQAAGAVDGPANEALQLEVRRHVRQLYGPTLAGRNAAEEALGNLGPEAVEFLPEITERTPAEVKLRLGRIRQRLQQAAAESATRSSTITLTGDDLPLSKVLAALQEQSGNTITDFRERFGHEVTDPALSVAFDKTPCWQALDDVLDKAGLTVYGFGRTRAINVIARGETRRTRTGSVGYGGPFRFEPVRVVAQRNLRQQDGQSLRLAMAVQWEPRLKPISVKQKMDELTVVDENGKPIAVDSGPTAIEASAADATSVELEIPLALPPRDVMKIASLKGRLTAIVPGKVETFRFDKLVDAQNVGAKDVEKRIAGVTVVLEQVRRNGAIWEMRLRIRFDEAGDALESHRSWVFQNEAYLMGPDGEKIPYDALETTRQSENEVGIAYGFVMEEPPAKHTFVYETPGAIMSATFDYEIKDVPLP